MSFVQPWTFLALAPVAVAALLALFRPRRNLVVAASLSLWAEAVSSAASVDRRKTRRINASWLLLLIGAIAAVCAAARPIYHSSGPVRSVAIVLHPSAELGSDGADEMRLAGGKLLERLDASDRVELLLPETPGRRGGWISPAQAKLALAEIEGLPVSVAELQRARPSPQAAAVFHLGPSSLDIAVGPSVTRIDIPTHLPPVTIDAVGAEKIAPDKLQVFAALRNQTDRPAAARLTVGDALGSGAAGKVIDVTIAPRSRKSLTAVIPPAGAVSLAVRSGDGQVARAYLVGVKMKVSSVAIVGRDDPYLRRLIEVDPTLRPTSDRAGADIIIANGVSPPPGKPALIIAPQTPPPSWLTSDAELGSIMLAGADVTADDPIMSGVDLSAAAIRRVRPWTRGDIGGGGVLIGYKGAALAVRSAADGPDAEPRRVWVAFDLSETNCTLVRSEAYVVLLANIMRFLAPGSVDAERYEYLTPLQAGVNPAWKPIADDKTFAPSALEAAGMTAPNIHRDAGGTLHAVSLVGLRAAKVAVSPDRAVEAADLGEPQPLSQGAELWSVLLAAAGAFWLAGWAAAALRD